MDGLHQSEVETQLLPLTVQVPAIVSDPKIMHGKPIIRGTRVTVEIILSEFAAGATIDHLLQEHPELTREQIKAALEFTARLVYPDYEPSNLAAKQYTADPYEKQKI